MESTSNVVQKTLSLKKAYNGPRCSVMNCNNSTRKRDELSMTLSFHRFPRDPWLQEQWIKRCRPLSYANILKRHVCSAHFEPRFFCKKHKPGSMTKLIEGTLPTLNLPPQLEKEPDPGLKANEKESNNPDTDPLEIRPVADTPHVALFETNKTYEQDIEMVELSSEDEGEEEVDVVGSRLTEDGSPAVTSAAALVATSALHIPKTSTSGPQPKLGARKSRRKSSIADKSPSKSLISMEDSMDGSMDSRFSDDDLEDEEIVFIPSEELEYIDLQDPLEVAYHTWKGMNEKARRATIKAYLCRLASFFPPRFPRNNMPSILESAVRYLDEVTKENAIMAIEQEILTQRHYILRKRRAKLDKIIKKKGYRKQLSMGTWVDS